MIADIFFSWNVLTTTMVVWMSFVSLAVVVDFVPELYREKKARDQLARSVAMIAERRQAAKPTFDPDKTFELGVFKIQPASAQRRRHAKV